MNLLTKGLALRDRLMLRDATPEDAEGLAASLTLYRKADPGNPIDLTGKAWVGRTVFKRLPSADAKGAAVVFGDRDYLVPRANLPAEPENGDRYVEVISGAAVTFEIQDPAGEPSWRWDAQRSLYRVHVKEVVPEAG